MIVYRYDLDNINLSNLYNSHTRNLFNNLVVACKKKSAGCILYISLYIIQLNVIPFLLSTIYKIMSKNYCELQ